MRFTPLTTRHRRLFFFFSLCFLCCCCCFLSLSFALREDDDSNDDDDDDSCKGIGSDESDGDGEKEEEEVAFPFRLEVLDDPFPELLPLRLLLLPELAKPRLTLPLVRASKGDTNGGGAEANDAKLERGGRYWSCWKRRRVGFLRHVIHFIPKLGGVITQ